MDYKYLHTVNGGSTHVHTPALGNSHKIRIISDKKIVWDVQFSKTQEFINPELYPCDIHKSVVENSKKIEHKLKHNYTELIGLAYKYRYLINNKEILTNSEKLIKSNIWYPILYYNFVNDRLLFILEIMKSFNLVPDIGKSKILSLSKNMFFPEAIYYLHEQKSFTHDHNSIILPIILKYYNYDKFDSTKIDEVAKLYNINNIKYVDSPLDHSYVEQINGEYDLVYLDPMIYHKNLSDVRENHNFNLFINLLLIMIKKLKKGGDCIVVHYGIRNSVSAQILTIINSVFESIYITNQEIGIPKIFFSVLVCKNYLGASDNTVNGLINLIKQMNKYDPSGGMNYNVLDKNNREKYNVTKDITSDTPTKYISNIIKLSTGQKKIYEDIKQFYTIKLSIYNSFINTLYDIDKKLTENKDSQTYIKSQQLYNSVNYAKMLDLKLKPTFDKNTFYDVFGTSILENMYNTDNMIKFLFKKRNCQKLVIMKTNINSFTLEKFNILNKLAIKFSNASRVIDYRDEENYYKFKKITAYYKSSLSKIIHHKYNGEYVTQAWLKMYEILSTFPVIDSKNPKFKSFHMCEAPGAFILATNHYVHTKTNIKDFSWIAQSLNPSYSENMIKHPDMFRDQFNLMKLHKNNWDFGADNNGDILNENNLRYYKEVCKDVDLITGDCGVKWDRSDMKYELDYAQTLCILSSLPKNKHFIFKSYLPIVHPLKISTYYLIYQRFREMYIYKPLQNPQSSEYYVVGIDYQDPLTEDEIEQMFSVLKNFSSNTSIFDINDIPDCFLFQLTKISKILVDNFEFAIDRIVYYMDNSKNVSDEHIKKIKQYADVKTDEWVEQFNIEKIDSKYKLTN